MKSPTLACILAGATGALVATGLPWVLTSSHADTKLLPFQGRLTDATGAAVGDGAKVVEFKLYDAPTGGNAKNWAGEVHKLSVNGGLVNTMLGSKASLGSVDFSTPTYLQITVDANADNQITAADPPLLPRQSVIGSVFASVAGGMQYRTGTGTFATANWDAIFNNGRPDTGRVPTTKLAADNGITAAQLAPLAVVTAALAVGAVTTEKIADGAILPQDLSLGLQNSMTPTGGVIAYAATTAPSGWELCDGREVSRTDPKYAALFAVIGVTHGTGNGTTTFNLPDYRGRFLRGADDADGPGGLAAAGRDPGDGREPMQAGGDGAGIGSVQEDAFKQHTHRINSDEQGNAGLFSNGFTHYGNIADTGPNSNLTTGPMGGSETRPKNAYVNYLIKY